MAPKKPEGLFADILADINKGSHSSNTVYLKDGDTQIKLIMPEGDTDLRQFYRKFMANFNGDLFPYFLVCGVVTDADEDDVADKTRIRYIKFPKSVMSEVMNLLQKKWKLFETEGPQIVVTKFKKNGKVGYSATAIPDVFSVEGMAYPTQTIDEAAVEQEELSNKMAADKENA